MQLHKATPCNPSISKQTECKTIFIFTAIHISKLISPTKYMIMNTMQPGNEQVVHTNGRMKSETINSMDFAFLTAPGAWWIQLPVFDIAYQNPKHMV